MRELITILLIALLSSCANMVPPSGGQKDVTPPMLKKSNPPYETTYFDKDEFQLEFDELITLESINSQLVVSPPLSEKPQVKYLKKKVTVKFHGEVLQENTTYAFNFGSAIVDFNAGNALKNFSYVFSTGAYIDSLSINGKVIDSYTKEPIDNMVVMLYRSDIDSLPLSSLPNYFGMTDEAGIYSINNIKEGKYKVFAVEDLNQNYLFDRPEERIAFYNEMIELDSNIYGMDLQAFTEESDRQFILKREKTKYGKLRYIFNEPINEFQILLKDEVFPLDEYKQHLSSTRDTLDFWFPDYEGDFTLIFKQDSTFSDTSKVKVVPIYSLDESPSFTINSNITGIVDLNSVLKLRFDNPIETWNSEFINLYEDSIKVNIVPVFSDSSKLQLQIPYSWKEKSKYILRVGLGSFVDFYDLKNEIYELKFGAQEESFYGKINLDINLDSIQPPFIFHLMDAEKKILNEQVLSQSRKVSYDFLRPVEYSFRLIQDLNGNGRWDSGDYSEKRQAEPVIYYPSSTKVRSNWEIDLTWEINTKSLQKE